MAIQVAERCANIQKSKSCFRASLESVAISSLPRANRSGSATTRFASALAWLKSACTDSSIEAAMVTMLQCRGRVNGSWLVGGNGVEALVSWLSLSPSQKHTQRQKNGERKKAKKNLSCDLKADWRLGKQATHKEAGHARERGSSFTRSNSDARYNSTG